MTSNAIEFNVSTKVNELYWISSLEDDKRGTSLRVQEDLEIHLNSAGVNFFIMEPANTEDFLGCLRAIADKTRSGSKPMIHIDTHGSENEGVQLHPSEDFVSWEAICVELSVINRLSSNNLLVISAACFGLHMAKEVSLTESAPFQAIIAPEKKITFGFGEDAFRKFYINVFQTSNLTAAFEENLASEMRMFHVEEMLVWGATAYFETGCIGKGKIERVERLMDEKFAEGTPNTRENRRKLRSILKKHIKPSRETYLKYAREFLNGFEPTVPYETIIKHIESKRKIEILGGESKSTD